MDRRAERPARRLEPERRTDRVAKLRFPEPVPCGRTPLVADGLSKTYGSLEVFTDVDLASTGGAGSSSSGSTAPGRHVAAPARRLEPPDTE
jgi:hypothetical protein